MRSTLALFVVLIGLVILNPITGIMALVSLFKFSLKSQDHGQRIVIQTANVIGWLAMSAGMTVLLRAGLIGFLGDNALPKTSHTLIWNPPAYVGTVACVLLAWMLRRRSRAAATVTN